MSRELGAAVLGVIALLAGVAQIFIVPFAFGPLALICLLVAIQLSPKHRGIYRVGVALVSLGFVVGASIAVATSNPLY